MKAAHLRQDPGRGTRTGRDDSAPALEPRHRRMLERWLRRWKVSRLAAELRVEFSPRLRRAFGRCYQRDRVIRLAPSLLGVQSYLLEEVLCHEAAHAAVYERYGSGCRPHGEQWQALMTVVGFEPRVRIPVAVRSGLELRSARRGPALFVLRCPVCRSARKAPRPTRRLRCSKCTRGGKSVAMKVVDAARGRTRRKASR